MTLRARLLLLFQGALALVLVGFSVSLYLLAAKYLRGQADERLEAALNTLAAAAEINDSGVEWEPEERKLSFGRRAVEGGFLWRVVDDQGRPIDGSTTSSADWVLEPRLDESAHRRRPLTVRDPSDRPWRVQHRLLEPSTTRRDDPRDEQPNSDEARPSGSLRLSAAVALDGILETEKRLALALGGLSAGLWLATLVLGDRLCRRALGPLTAMADAAHAIGGDHPGQRLPIPETGDELEDLGRSFNALLGRLHESFERQRRFTGDASHQLRTPLTAIQGQVDLALRQERDPGEYRRVLGLVQGRTRHLRQIVESLLFLARADAEALRPELVPLDLSEWLPDHLRSRPDSPRSADVRSRVVDDGAHVVLAHPSLLGELVDNLLDNAARYGPPGSAIEVRVRRDGSAVTLAVEDQGVGIAEDDLPRLFEPFFRAPAARDSTVAGSGLGLAIAHRLAGVFNATIEVASKPGRGSTFTLRFPGPEPASQEQPARDS